MGENKALRYFLITMALLMVIFGAMIFIKKDNYDVVAVFYGTMFGIFLGIWIAYLIYQSWREPNS